MPTLPVKTLTAALLVATLALANPQGGYRLLAEPCAEELSSYTVADAGGAAVDLPFEVQAALYCAYGVDLAPGGRFLLYPLFDADGVETIHVYDLAERAETDKVELPPAEMDALGYTWSENPTRFAFAPGDRANPLYYRTYVFQLSPEGRLSAVGAYDLRLKPVCGPDGCEPLAGESFYFASAHTLVYRTWEQQEDEPDGPQTLQKVKLP